MGHSNSDVSPRAGGSPENRNIGAYETPPGAKIPEVNYLNEDRGIMSWVLTLDHKRIALMYFVLTTAAFLLGGIFAMAVRIEHLTPDRTIMGANTYNRMFTL